MFLYLRTCPTHLPQRDHENAEGEQRESAAAALDTWVQSDSKEVAATVAAQVAAGRTRPEVAAAVAAHVASERAAVAAKIADTPLLRGDNNSLKKTQMSTV